MTNLAFDTYHAVKELEQAGMPVKQAESVVATLRKSREFDVSHLATKMDLNKAKSELKAEIVASETKLDKKIDKVEAGLKAEIALLQVSIAGVQVGMIKWIVPLLLGQTALIAALVKLLQSGPSIPS